MAAWTTRSSGYKIGFCLLFLGGLFYVIGFGSPYWIDLGSGSLGLWLICGETYTGTECISIPLDGTITLDSAWFRVVQVFQCFALIGLGISGLFALYDNCCRTAPRFTRVLEILAGCTGVTGFVACMIFVGKTDEFYKRTYSWGFGLDLTGCLFIAFSAIVILISNRADANTSTPGTAYYPFNPQGDPGGVVTYPPAGTVPAQYPAGTVPAQYPAGTVPAQYPAGTVPAQYPAGAVPAQYPAGAVPQYLPAVTPQYFPGAAPQYPPGTAPQYPPGTAPQCPPGVTPQYLPAGGNPQGGYMAGVPPQAGYSGVSDAGAYSGASQEKGNVQ